MKTMLKLLLKVRFAEMFSSLLNRQNKRKNGKRSNEGKKGGIILLAILLVFAFACFMIMIGSMFVQFGDSLKGTQIEWLYFSFAGVLGFMMCFIGSVFATHSQIFEAKDNEMLFSLPIKPIDVLVSRMAYLLILNLFYVLLFMLPATVVYFVLWGFSVVVLLQSIIATVALCFISLAFSTLIAWLVGLITSKMRKKNFFSMILFAAFFAVYIYVCSNLQGCIQKLIANGAAIATAIRRYIPPFYFMGTGIGQLNVLHFLYFLLICVVPFIIVCLLVSRSFIKIATTKKGNVKVKYKEKEMKVKGSRLALVNKELSHFFSLSAYLLNCGLGAALEIVLSLALAVKGKSIVSGMLTAYGIEEETVGELVAYLPFAVCVIVCFCAVMTVMTAASVSLEGHTVYMLKSLPVKTGDVLFAKVTANMIIGVPPVVLVACVSCFVFDMTAVQMVCILLAPIFAQLFTALFGLIMNLSFPKLDWSNAALIVKQSKSVMITTFVGMGALLIPIFLTIVLGDTNMLFITAFFAVADIILFIVLKSVGVKKYESI